MNRKLFTMAGAILITAQTLFLKDIHWPFESFRFILAYIGVVLLIIATAQWLWHIISGKKISSQSLNNLSTQTDIRLPFRIMLGIFVSLFLLAIFAMLYSGFYSYS